MKEALTDIRNIIAIIAFTLGSFTLITYISLVLATGQINPISHKPPVCSEYAAVKSIQPVPLLLDKSYFAIATNGATIELNQTARIGQVICFHFVKGGE
jgi:hypothetical protein